MQVLFTYGFLVMGMGTDSDLCQYRCRYGFEYGFWVMGRRTRMGSRPVCTVRVRVWVLSHWVRPGSVRAMGMKPWVALRIYGYEPRIWDPCTSTGDKTLTVICEPFLPLWNYTRELYTLYHSPVQFFSS